MIASGNRSARYALKFLKIPPLLFSIIDCLSRAITFDTSSMLFGFSSWGGFATVTAKSKQTQLAFQRDPANQWAVLAALGGLACFQSPVGISA